MSVTDDKMNSGKPSAPAEDRSGRDRMAINVLASWGGYSVHVVAGFILPRLIDNSLGQISLGIWDFGWSVVSYFGIMQLGIGSSVNRFVAKHHAEDDTDAMNRSVSSVMSVQLVAALAAMLATLVTAWYLPEWFGARLGDNVDEAQWVLLLLGIAIATQLGFDAFNGVMTGIHRWELHNAINAGFQGFSALAMTAVLWSGGGLRGLATAYLATLVATEILRAAVVFRLCPQLRLRWRFVEMRRSWEMFVFGSKTLLGSFAELLMYQTTYLLLAGYMGPAALALFARPVALVRHVKSFVQKFAFVLTPTVSSMDAAGKQGEIREFFIASVRYGAHMALPPIVLLATLGGEVIDVWMGSRYVRPELIAILALGYLLGIAHAPVLNILIGLNRHGHVMLGLLVAAFATTALAWLMLEFTSSGLVGVALSIVLPSIVVQGVVIPYYACRHLGLSLLTFYFNTWTRPLLCVLPFAATLIGLHMGFPGESFVQLIGALVLGGPVLFITYWYWVLPDGVRGRIRRRLQRGGRRQAQIPGFDPGMKD